jgi:hypothetical protein
LAPDTGQLKLHAQRFGWHQALTDRVDGEKRPFQRVYTEQRERTLVTEYHDGIQRLPIQPDSGLPDVSFNQSVVRQPHRHRILPCNTQALQNTSRHDSESGARIDESTDLLEQAS